MKILWSIPARGERLGSSRGDLVRAKRMIEALRQIGHEVRVVEFGSPPAVSAYRQVFSRVLPPMPAMVARDAGRWLASIQHGRRAALQATRFGADVIVETQVGFSFSGAVAAKKTGLPLILDDCSPSCEEEILGAGLPSLARHALRRLAQTAALVVATSQEIAESLAREGVPGEKIRLIPNGVALRDYTRAAVENARQRIGLADSCVIGFAGSFQPWHASGLLVNALETLRDNPLWHLLLVGDGPALKPALEKLNSLGLGVRTTATGPVSPEAVPELVGCFDIGVLPGSTNYCNPMKLFEYAAAGAAIVAPDLPPVRRIIRNLNTGLLFKPGNREELAAALRMLLFDAGLRSRLADEARRSIGFEEDWSARGRKLALAIEPILTSRRSIGNSNAMELPDHQIAAWPPVMNKPGYWFEPAAQHRTVLGAIEPLGFSRIKEKEIPKPEKGTNHEGGTDSLCKS
ncbi:MAG: glycosyltransferase [Acidobacteria bacterium]|nr:glycosyltransferase [Acidobacteriota bacterium]